MKNKMSYQVVSSRKEFHYNQGSIQIEYNILLNLFGDPQVNFPKSDANWIIQFGEIEASIYNWNPNKDRNPIILEKINNWNIGGSSIESFEFIKSLLSFNLNVIKRAINEI
jgi:hypothetical protein